MFVLDDGGEVTNYKLVLLCPSLNRKNTVVGSIMDDLSADIVFSSSPTMSTMWIYLSG